MFWFCMILLSPVVSQEYDQSYFRSPVDHKMRLSGSFAELRTNHFHMGIDIKSSNGRSGDPIFAVADGVISRINVDASGYGNAIYIDHDNGYTTVYAHLSAFSDTLSNYISKEQYRTKIFQQQLYPDSIFYVEQGDLIGRMGNTGKSFGPHLHFEIRETESEAPVNPFLFGLKPTDKRPPIFQAIRFYKIDSLGASFIKEKKVMKKALGLFTLDEDIVNLSEDKIGISVQVYDQMDGAYNKNGVYRMKMLVNDKVRHGYKVDKVTYEESHYINSFIDFGEKQDSKRQFSNCFTNPVDQLSIYEHSLDRNGIIQLSQDTSTEIKIVLQDFHGNESLLSFKTLLSESNNENLPEVGNYSLVFDQSNIIRVENADFIFKARTFANDHQIQVSESLEVIDGNRLPVFNIGNSKVPLFKPYKLYIKNLEIQDSLKTHFTIAKCGDKEIISYIGEWIDSSTYLVELGSLGTFQCMLDTIRPKISPVNLKYDMSGEKQIKLKITDNMGPGAKKLRLKYDGFIDGKWVLFKYDLKNDLIFYEFDEMCPPGEHILKLTVYDNRGNSSSLSHQFTNFSKSGILFNK